MNDQTGNEKPSDRSIDNLIGRERIRGASRMIAQGTDASAVSPEQILQVASDVQTFTRAHKIFNKALARAIGYSPGVISEFFKGTYNGNKGQVAIDLEAWLVEEEARRLRPATTQFVWTNVAMKIKAVASYCLDKKTIGLAYGPDTSGVGKTITLQAIFQELGPRRCSLATINKVDAHPTGLTKKLCAAMHLDGSGSNRHRYQRCVEFLKGRSHLLLIDQAHNMRHAADDKPLYILADLYDETKTAQLWVGTADMVGYLEGQQRRSADESLAQLRRRIFPRIDLMDGLASDGSGGGEPLVTVEQIREMFARNSLKLSDRAARWLCMLANTPDSGSVGLCVQVVDYATALAEMRNLKNLDLPIIQEALRAGFSPKRALELETRAEQRIAQTA